MRHSASWRAVQTKSAAAHLPICPLLLLRRRRLRPLQPRHRGEGRLPAQLGGRRVTEGPDKDAVLRFTDPPLLQLPAEQLLALDLPASPGVPRHLLESRRMCWSTR